MQKEAFILGTPCITLRDSTEWVETVQAGGNCLVGADTGRILQAVEGLGRRPARRRTPASRLYGDGHAAEAIASRVLEFLGR